MTHWKQRLRCRMPRARVRRAWMVWAIWGMLGTSLTMEGTTGVLGLHGLSVAGLLTAPFWLAFALWPCFFIWRWFMDRSLWAEEVVPLIYDPTGENPFELEVIIGRDGIKVAVDEVLSKVGGSKDALRAVQRNFSTSSIGIDFATYDAKVLIDWGRLWLKSHPNVEGEVTMLARWTERLNLFNKNA